MSFVFDGLAVEIPAPEIPVLEESAPVVPGAVVLPFPGPQGQPGPQGPEGGTADLQSHIDSETPHPAYDDMPSLSLIFENHLL
jgi:hypothetical protein